MATIYEELSNAMAAVKKLKRDLAAIVEAAEQTPIDGKQQQKINYYTKQKDSKEENNKKELELLEQKRSAEEKKFDADIEALKQKKELALQKLDKKIDDVKNCSTLRYYDDEIKRLLDDAMKNRVKTQVEIRKEMELKDMEKKVQSLEETINIQRISQQQFDNYRKQLEMKQEREYRLLKEERERALRDYEIICKNNPVPHTLDDEPDFLPEPESQ
jgi:hypothetical protein